MINLESTINMMLFMSHIGGCSLIIVMLLVICFMKPFFARGWLISAVCFFLVTSIYEGSIVLFYELYNNVPFGLDRILYIVINPVLSGFAKFSLLMFLFVNFIKSNFNLDVNNFLFSYKGRISRVHYWFTLLIISTLSTPLIIGVIASHIYKGFYFKLESLNISIIVVLSIILFFISWVAIVTNIKRLHDLNKSGWHVLLQFIPIVGWFFTVYLGVKRGTEGKNEYGESTIKSENIS